MQKTTENNEKGREKEKKNGKRRVYEHRMKFPNYILDVAKEITPATSMCMVYY